MKKFFKIMTFVVLVVIFLGTFVFLYQKSKAKPVVYDEVKPEITTIERTTVITGKIQPRDEVNIKPQINGIISELLKKAGDEVKAGDVIAKISVIPEMSSLSSAQSRIEIADINLKQEKTNFDRAKALYDKELISADEFDKAKQAYDQAKVEKNAAIDAFEIVKNGVSKSNASSSSTLVRSTVNGLILDIPVKVGNSVIQANAFNDGTTVATVADMNNLIFAGKVDETEVGKLAPGMKMKINIGAMQDMQFDAILEFIAPKSIEENGTNVFEIKAAVTVPKGSNIRSGYSANAEISLEKAENVLSIAESTVEFSGDSTFVYVKTGEQQYIKTPVKLGLSDGLKIEVKEGLDSTSVLRGAIKPNTK